MNSLELLLKYPLISTRIENDNSKHYTGLIQTKSDDLKLEIIENSSKIFKIGANSDDKIKNSLEITNSLLVENDIISILDSFKQPHIDGADGIANKNVYKSYRKVLNEYSEFTKFYLNLKTCALSKDLTKIMASTLDQKNREHSIEMTVDLNDSKTVYRAVNLNLPGSGNATELKSSSISAIYNEFLNLINRFQPYFDIMDAFDANCHILDPKNPQKCHNYRRIWLESNLSIVITIDPYNVKGRPDIKFLGPERLAQTYRCKLNKKLYQWDEKIDLYQQILDIMDLDSFPPKLDISTSSSVDIAELLIREGECSICFSSLLNNKVPDVICQNKSCEKFYHRECLSEWLISINGCKVFNEICGPCPNCEKKIACPLN